ncbi:hypothetical protein L873DRAFT_477997 [Choiromyces venosus 120613-1]|uniref:Uncharacterized protein n=1 Tax=Choiromyces venosus 120613-1 TaxID=1336337 RepID=A0A3N4IZE9_9PEZI|nr:hypothetical protein L873DRAFT_477997 [Choiromyces venosus 120613-1]
MSFVPPNPVPSQTIAERIAYLASQLQNRESVENPLDGAWEELVKDLALQHRNRLSVTENNSTGEGSDTSSTTRSNRNRRKRASIPEEFCPIRPLPIIRSSNTSASVHHLGETNNDEGLRTRRQYPSRRYPLSVGRWVAPRAFTWNNRSPYFRHRVAVRYPAIGLTFSPTMHKLVKKAPKTGQDMMAAAQLGRWSHQVPLRSHRSVERPVTVSY